MLIKPGLMDPSLLKPGICSNTRVTTNNHSEGYNFRLGNKKTIGKHPNFFQFVQTIILELGISHDDATASVVGNANKRASRKKFLRNMELREKLMADLEEGHTALLSFQQAIGGSLSRSERVCEDHDQDEEPLPISRSGSTVIVVPPLEEILVPAALTQHPPSFPPSNILLSVMLMWHKREHQIFHTRWVELVLE